ncbi:MAG: efflux RND transporter permease subunit [Deltaproteobacteria bacterium]|nr:MAG: efflux RND transporter permease subunit [Deltaproteobacteria bacterium]
MRNLIRWLVEHPVVVNLLMVSLCVIGFLSISSLPKEVFPETSQNMILVRVPYRGAGPTEIEKGIVLKIEEAIQQIDGIEQLTAESMENIGMLRLEVSRGVNPERVLREVKDQLDQITSFPRDADRPLAFEIVRRVPVMQLALHGDIKRAALQQLGQTVKDELLALSLVSQVQLDGYKQPEISIEIDEKRLRQFGLQVSDVGRAVSRANLDLSGGMIKTKREDLMIRVYGKRYLARAFARIPIRSVAGGSPIHLEDVATVRETFDTQPNSLYFNAKPALLLTIFRSLNGDSLAIAAQVHEYLKSVGQRLPSKTYLSVYQDQTVDLKARLMLLINNGWQGLLLVLITLALLMNLRLAFWVAAGLPISILGALILMNLTGTTINMISMFGMILVIGILVDDAIVVSENVYAHIEKGTPPLEAAVTGTWEVFPAVFASVSTTILAFIPLFFMGGRIGTFIYMIPTVVILCLSISLLESFLILPAHLAHSLDRKENADGLMARIRGVLEGGFLWVNRVVYARVLHVALRYRWPVLAASLFLAFLCVGAFRGGKVRFVFFPELDGNRVVARFILRPGTPEKETRRVAMSLLHKATGLARELRQKEGKEILVASLVRVGSQTLRSAEFSPPSGEEVGEVQLELVPGEKRRITSRVIAAMWRAKVGSVPQVSQISFSTLDTPPVGRPIELQLLANGRHQLERALRYLKQRLVTFAGVSDPEDDLTLGKRELRFKLKPLAHSMSVSLQDIAQQLRDKMYGWEVMRLQRDRDEVRVFVRYPMKERRQLQQLEKLWIRTGQGQEMPLTSLATWTYTRDLQVLRRLQRKQIVTLTAQLDETRGNRQEIVQALQRNELVQLAKLAPDVKVVFGGQGREQKKVFQGMKTAFPLALFGIFVILVIVFQSYAQALIIMAMIPFGVVGAVGGHWMMGVPLTILSLFGVVGLSGVVVNDSLVYMDTINRNLEGGQSEFQAAWEAGQSRLRAILSTTLTTCVGLAPLLFEKSRQAQFLIPMAISLAFGVLFATFLTLVLVPSLYLIVHDLKRLWHWLRHGSWPEANSNSNLSS